MTIKTTPIASPVTCPALSFPNMCGCCVGEAVIEDVDCGTKLDSEAELCALDSFEVVCEVKVDCGSEAEVVIGTCWEELFEVGLRLAGRVTVTVGSSLACVGVESKLP